MVVGGVRKVEVGCNAVFILVFIIVIFRRPLLIFK